MSNSSQNRLSVCGEFMSSRNRSRSRKGQISRQTQPSFPEFLEHCMLTFKVKAADFMRLSMDVSCSREVAMRQGCLSRPMDIWRSARTKFHG
jgi:hypothetical protein